MYNIQARNLFTFRVVRVCRSDQQDHIDIAIKLTLPGLDFLCEVSTYASMPAVLGNMYAVSLARPVADRFLRIQD